MMGMFHMKHNFDVLVIGGGHAGCEAAHAASRMGADVGLISLSKQDFGVMSCNPAIGGLGKGHLVREIDALDGIMGDLADRSGIQFRLLNRKKGPAVQGPRTQADRQLYRKGMLDRLKSTPRLMLIEGEVVGLLGTAPEFRGVELADGSTILCSALVLTTGTFLGGVIHIGDKKISGGRLGASSAKKLAHQLSELDLPLGRLKTGTPPRLDGETISWDGLEMQDGDEKPSMFSFLNTSPFVPQISCGITHTNEQTHDIIRKNLSKSAMYGGDIDSIGPRYCPSIEDKIVRFGDKNSHQIFLEPEGLNTKTIYPNGISTSLPVDVQEQYVRSIRGLETVKILQPGYAIEYDFIDPRCLTETLLVQETKNFFLAGQINGTTGYEEAAAQGLVAGLNAACLVLQKEAITFSRSNSYIGVMVDDLTLRGVNEPYRMFTSRAEYRLSLRSDNADQRLTPIGIAVGCVGKERATIFNKKNNLLGHSRTCLETIKVSPQELQDLGVNVKLDGQRRSLFHVLSLPKIDLNVVCSLSPQFSNLDSDLKHQLSIEALYSNYVDRQKKDLESLKRDEAVKIPSDFDYLNLPGLSNELKSKLVATKPPTLGHAGRIDGMTPSALVLLLSKLRKNELSRSA
jgi:tRNA uridine 5-carboxymethylaminomethyl modification enzyme